LLPPPHGRVPCAWLGIGAQQPSGVTNSGDGQPLLCNRGDGAYVAASCFTKQAGGSDPKICRDPEESPLLVSSSPPSTSNTGDRATACTLGIVAHAGYNKGPPIFAGPTRCHVPMFLGWAAHHFQHTRSLHPTAMDVFAEGVPSIQT
jgi:hypothetical protein